MSIYRSVLSSKGQLVIPAKLRKQLRMKAGIGVTLELQGDRILVVPDSSVDWRSMHGCLKGKSSALEYLQAERKKEREREDKL
jgi:AbrB family looped-hinge helix DNA binding protein